MPIDNRPLHLGEYRVYEYWCPNHSIVLQQFQPDYPYVAPPAQSTCERCAAVTMLVSGRDIFGRPSHPAVKKVVDNPLLIMA